MSATTRRQYYRVLKSVDNKAIRVRLTVPAPDETCPLTFSPVSEDELDFLPGLTFFEASPLVRQLTLPCGHTFGALNLLYHFARRNMLCPCCRRGAPSPINPKYIPKHLRPAIVARVTNEAQQERAEQINEDMALVAQDAAQSPWFTLVDRVQMSVYPVDFPFVSFEYQLAPGFVLAPPAASLSPPIVFELSLDDSRTISSRLRDLAVTHVSLVVHARSVTDRVVELARTDEFDILAAPGADRIVDSGASHFSVAPEEAGGVPALKWTTPAAVLHALLQ
jgi:hypothetical protein